MSTVSRIAISAIAILTVAGCVVVSDPKSPASTSSTATTAQGTATSTGTVAPADTSTTAVRTRGHHVHQLNRTAGAATGTATTAGTVAPPGPGVFGDSSAKIGALKGDIFWIPENSTALPDLDKLTPVSTVWAQQLNIAPRSFLDGFPGISNRVEWFAVRYVGQFTVAAAGDYKFRILSDDGTRVYVDGAQLIENDGVHSAQDKSATTKLTAGIHFLRVDYFQGPRESIALQLWVTAPNKTEALWSSSM